MTLAARVRESQFLRFALIGGFGFFVNEAALYCAIHFLSLNAYAAGVLAFLVTVTFTWLGNRLLTFAHEAAHGVGRVVAEWARFVAANALGFIVNYTVYASLVRFAPAPLNSPYIALAFGTLAGLIFNFALSKRFVFRAG